MINLYDWYWFIGGDISKREPASRAAPEGSKLYSSKRNTYVPDTDPGYVDWIQTNRFAQWVSAESDIWVNLQTVLSEWLWNGETFSQPADGQYHQYQLQQYSALMRWQTETKGITTSAPQKIPLRTDDRSKQMIGNAAAQARINSSFATSWVGADGKIYPVNATDMIKMGDEVAAWVDKCFDKYAQTDADIKSGTLTTLKQIEDAYASI